MRPASILVLLSIVVALLPATPRLAAQSDDVAWMRGGHTARVTSVGFLTSGECVTTSFDRTIKVWSPESGELLRTVETSYGISCAAISDDGRWLLAGTLNGDVLVYDATTWAHVRTLATHPGMSVLSVSVDRELQILCTTGDLEIRLWRFGDGAHVRTLRGHTSPVEAAALTPDGRHVISASGDFTVRIWDAVTGALLKTIAEVQYTAQAVAVARDGSFFAARGYSPPGPRLHPRGISLYSIPDGTLLSGHNVRHLEAVTAIALSPDSRIVASTSTDPLLIASDIGNARPAFTAGAAADLTACAFSRDGRSLAWGSATGSVWLARLSTDSTQIVDSAASEHGFALSEFLAPVATVASSPDGATLVTGSASGRLVSFDARTGSVLRRVDAHTAALNDIAYSSDGATLATASSDGAVKLWDTVGMRLRKILYLSSEWPVAGVRFIDRDQDIAGALGPGDSTIILVDTATNAFEATFSGHSGAVRTIGVSADEELLASAGDDGTIRIWSLADNSLVRTIDAHDDVIDDLAVSSDGIVASGSRQGALALHDIANGAEIIRIDQAHDGPIQALDFSKDGNLLATVGLDSTLRIWQRDAEGIHQVYVYRDYPFAHLAVALDADAEVVAAGTSDATLIVRHLRTRSDVPADDAEGSALDAAVRSRDGAATLSFRLTLAEHVVAELVDARGAVIATVHDGLLAPGRHALRIPSASLPRGAGFVTLRAGGRRTALPLHRVH